MGVLNRCFTVSAAFERCGGCVLILLCASVVDTNFRGPSLPDNCGGIQKRLDRGHLRECDRNENNTDYCHNAEQRNDRQLEPFMDAKQAKQ